MDKNLIVTNRFVKSEDLNHHGTLFAGRTSEWFVETGLWQQPHIYQLKILYV